MNLLSEMASPPLTTVFLIVGLVFLTLAVVGNSRLGFAEVNPGCFGRFLALTIGLFSLIIAGSLAIFPVEMVEPLKTSVAQWLQQNLELLTQFKVSS